MRVYRRKKWDHAEAMKNKPMREILETLYIQDKVPATRIAKVLSVTDETVYEWMRILGIPRRKKLSWGENNHARISRKLLLRTGHDFEWWIRKTAWEDEKEAAKRIGVHHMTVKCWRHRLGCCKHCQVYGERKPRTRWKKRWWLQEKLPVCQVSKSSLRH